MALVASSQPNKALKLFSSKLYKIRARHLDFLVQNFGPFTIPTSSNLYVNIDLTLLEYLLQYIHISCKFVSTNLNA